MLCFNLFGGGFASKCKSLVKKVKKRAEVMRRKRLVVVGYLKQDIAHLLRDGHHSHALDRVDALKCEIERAWCYDYIEKTCASLLEQLSSMQRRRDCPVQCVELVACVMFSAARFAALPELSGIRRSFIDKYGSSLEVQVNQKFVEKIASKPTTSDQKLEVLQNIAREFSLEWNGKQPNHKISDLLAAQHDNKSTFKQAPDSKFDFKNEGREVAPNQSIKMPNMLVHQGRKESAMKKSEHVDRNKDSSCDRIPDYTKRESDDISYNRIRHYTKRESEDSLYKRIPDYTKRESEDSSYNRLPDYTKRESEDTNKVSPNLYKEPVRNMRPGYDKMLPPPYLKPNKPKSALPVTYTKASQQESNLVTENIDSIHNKDTPMLCNKGGSSKQNVVQANRGAARQGEEENHGCEDASVIRSDQKSVRKTRASLSAIENQISTRDMENVGCPRKDGRRRKDNDTHRKDIREDEEEAIMDKLLIHYSKKSAPSKNHKIQPDFQASSSNEHGENGKQQRLREARAPVRTISLPSKAATESEKKIPVRAASFKPESSNQRHVHPKLPDYDDLAARIAALRSEQ